MAINFAERYSRDVLESLFARSVTNMTFNARYDYEFTGVDKVNIYSVDTPPLTFYDTSLPVGERFGTPADLGDTVQTLQMTKFPATTFAIDKTNNTRQLMIKNATVSIGEWFLKQLVPYKDKYSLGVIAGKAPVANQLTYTDGTDSIYGKVLDAQQKLDDGFVRREGRFMWATPAAINLMKKDENFIGGNSLAQDQVKFKGQVGEIDGLPIIMATESVMPENTLLIVVHPEAIVSPIRMEEARVHVDPVGLAGHLGEALVFFDTFVLEGREACIATLKKP